jgi:predicted O-methyltransferase YrrM
VPVSIYPEDGFEVIKRHGDGEVDLLYLDANDYDPTDASNQGERRTSKNINYGLLKKGYDKIRPGGVVLCHNAYQPSFLRDAADYLDFTADESFFEKTATIGIDEMGLEFSVKMPQ